MQPVEVPRLEDAPGPPFALFVPAPRLLFGDGGRRRFRPARDTMYEVGDLLGLMPDGTAAPPSSFSGRAAFAAAFLGCSNVHIEPRRILPGLRTNPTLTRAGGVWAFVVHGDVVQPNALLGPALIDVEGVLKLSGQVLEVVPADEAIGEAVFDDGRVCQVKLKGGVS